MFDFDLWGRRKSKKQRKRETLERNRQKGRWAEDVVAMQYALSGHEVERVHKGADLRIRRRDPFTGRVISTKLVEVKSGDSPLSPLQKKVRKKKRTRIGRVDSPFF